MQATAPASIVRTKSRSARCRAEVAGTAAWRPGGDLLENSVEAVVGVFAAMKAGAVFMLVNPSMQGRKADILLDHSRAAAIVGPARS